MTNTLSLSRSIVAALVERGIEVPQEWRNDVCYHCGTCDIAVPDLAQPQNLHLLLAVADSGGRPCEIGVGSDDAFGAVVWTGAWYTGTGPTRTLAILAAVCAALGIDTTQEDEG